MRRMNEVRRRRMNVVTTFKTQLSLLSSTYLHNVLVGNHLEADEHGGILQW